MNIHFGHPSVDMRVLNEVAALLVALVVTLEPAKSKEATKYKMAHVEATSWSGAQTSVHSDPM